MWCAKLILVSCLGTVYCRPQDQQPTNIKDVDPNTTVESHTDTDQELRPNINLSFHKKIEANTREILEKIAEVNKIQGLTHQKFKPNYFHFPFTYSRAQYHGDKYTNFKFSKDPFTNPVLAYLENQQKSNMNKDTVPSFRRSNVNGVDSPNPQIMTMTDPDANVEPEDNIPGHYIKRKITHYQGFLMPNPYMLNMYNVAPSNLPLPSEQFSDQLALMPSASYPPNSLYQFPMHQLGMYPVPTLDTSESLLQLEKNRSRLEKGTVEHNKNIDTGTIQNLQSSNFYSYFPTSYSSLPIGYQNFLEESSLNQQKLNIKLQNIPNLGSHMVQSNIFSQDSQERKHLYNQNISPNYAAVASRQPGNARQNWNWPGANLFPIYIRDPFLQMYYAFTNMIEYGPNSGNDGPCKLTPRPQGTRIKVNSKTTPVIKDKDYKVNLNINKKIETADFKTVDLKNNAQTDNVPYLDVEDIDIGGDELVKFTINIPEVNLSGGRELKDDAKFVNNRFDKFHQLHNNSALLQLASGKLDFLSTSTRTESPLVNKQLTPISNQVLHVEEIEDEPLEAEKAEDISVSNQGNKKVFSRENTGNGIFIQKLKVRQGGVAIAGPGGIATAGSGGTAIVGPNGIAYTHPHGLAIAGSGTKVIAVDPEVDLNEVIKDSVMNGTRHVPNTRVGKIVAIGPIVYYNRG